MVVRTEPNRGKDCLAAIIVAAGYSFRMKRFKPLLSLGGRTVLEKAVQSFRNAGISDIRVVVGHRANELYPVLDRLGVQAILNPDFSEGMFSSVVAGVKSLENWTTGFFLLPVDNPLINRDTLEKLQETFFSSDCGIVYPTYQGMRGHPPLIAHRYVHKVLNWDQPGGMRALLEQYEYDVKEVNVIDRGIMLDMDTPEDYQMMLKYCGDTQIPSEEECYAIIKGANTPERVVKHCKQVAELCHLIAEHVVNSGCQLNLKLIRAAALLHDIAKGESQHALVGARMLADYPEVAEIVAEHMDISLTEGNILMEKEIVYLADKLIMDDRIVSLQDRFAGPLELHKNNQEVFRKIKRRFCNAQRIQIKIEEIIKMPLHEILNADLGGHS